MGTTGDGVVGSPEGMYDIEGSNDNIDQTLPTWLMREELIGMPTRSAKLLTPRLQLQSSPPSLSRRRGLPPDGGVAEQPARLHLSVRLGHCPVAADDQELQAQEGRPHPHPPP